MNDDSNGRGYLSPVTILVAMAVVLALTAVATAGYAIRHRDPAVAGASADPLQPTGSRPDIPLQPLTVLPIDTVSQGWAVSVPWRLEAISNDGRQLTIDYLVDKGSCTQPVGIVVDQRSSLVLLEPIGRNPAFGTKGFVTCLSMVSRGRAVVTLDAPLRSRQLLHAKVSPLYRQLR